MFADVREKSMLEWIEENTATGTFCHRARKHTTLTPPPGHIKLLNKNLNIGKCSGWRLVGLE